MNDYEKHKSFKYDVINQKNGSIKEVLFGILGLMFLGLLIMGVIGWLLYYVVTTMTKWFNS